jgi:hypothetical protein
MKYVSGYKYQLHEDIFFQTDILVDVPIIMDWCSLNQYGMLYIKKGYAWNGPSGPTVDTPAFMIASLPHDVLYQMMGNKLLDEKFRINADNLLRKVCIEHGMAEWRAFYVYWGVRLFGGRHLIEDKINEA